MLLGLLSAYAETTEKNPTLCKLKLWSKSFTNTDQGMCKIRALKNHTGHKTELTLCY